MDNPEPGEHVLGKWQSAVDIMAEILEVPAALIMRIDGPDLEVFVASASAGNPYVPGQRECLVGSGLYCERVIRTKAKLIVPDATADPEWDSNPDIKLGMISYLGFPILLPSGEAFGTICVLDCKGNAFGERYERLLLEFKELIESHLALLDQARSLEGLNHELERRLSEIHTLKGIIPICAVCKKVRDDDGFWQAVELYVSKRSEADFSHGVCPDCYEEYYRPLVEKQTGSDQADAGPDSVERREP